MLISAARALGFNSNDPAMGPSPPDGGSRHPPTDLLFVSIKLSVPPCISRSAKQLRAPRNLMLEHVLQCMYECSDLGVSSRPLRF